MPKRIPTVVQTVLSLLAMTLLAASCMGGHDPNYRLGGDRIDAAPPPLEVIDASATITCTGSECTCPTGYACDFVCPDGDCEITCEAESKCDIDCMGGSCLITCGLLCLNTEQHLAYRIIER